MFFPSLDDLAVFEQSNIRRGGGAHLQGDAALGRDFIAHDGIHIVSLGGEVKASGRGGEVVSDEAVPFGKRCVDHLLIRIELAGQRTGKQDMGVDGFEMKFIGKDHAPQRAEVHFVGMCVRAADGNDATLRQQFIPFAQGGGDWMVRNELGEEGVECAVDFGGNQALQFAKPVPKLEAGEIRERPIHP